MEQKKILEDILNPENVNGTILSFKKRGPWGCEKYRGNASGYITAFLIEKYKIKYLGEMYAGSGTSYDVAKDFNISYFGMDLNPNPIKPGIVTLNALTDEIPEEIGETDFIFQHMPYPQIGIKYAGGMYADPSGKLASQDIGQMPFYQGMKANNFVTMKLYAAMHPGAKMGILCGSVRKAGVLYDMLLNLQLPGVLVQRLVKTQHNCMSNAKTYSNQNFIPITHEDLVVIQKPFEPGLFLAYSIPQEKKIDVRNSKDTPWRDVIKTVMHAYGNKEIHYSVITETVKDFRKAENNHHLSAKVRQTLATYKKTFTPCGGGYYKLAVGY